MLNFFNLEFISKSNLFLVATIVLFIKTILSITTSKRVLLFLSNESAHASRRILINLERFSQSAIASKNSQEWIQITTYGSEILFTRVIASLSGLISDLTLILSIVGLLFFFSFTKTIALLFFLGFTLILMKLLIQKKLRTLSIENHKLEATSRQLVSEKLQISIELNLRGTSEFYLDQIFNARAKLSKTISQLAFIPFISKYLMETVLTFAVLIIFLFQSGESSGNVTSITVFIFAASRIAPSVLRMQQSFITINSYFGIALEVQNLVLLEDKSIYKGPFEKKNFVPNVILNKVNFTYPGASTATLQELDLQISAGEQIAIIGKSGSGKSTLLSLLLGINTASSGVVQISGVNANSVSLIWPGKISYVPQEPTIINGTLRENILLGLNPSKYSDDQIISMCQTFGLSDFLLSIHGDLEYKLTSSGGNLSGGQKQRLALIRALISDPEILILDEFTSALDEDTESQIVKAILGLQSKTTVIAVTHRARTYLQFPKVYEVTNKRLELIT
jgi:ABC-type bacteriocin/lantibiotic exporter with double-glycine peptidase domain